MEKYVHLYIRLYSTVNTSVSITYNDIIYLVQGYANEYHVQTYLSHTMYCMYTKVIHTLHVGIQTVTVVGVNTEQESIVRCTLWCTAHTHYQSGT